MTGRHLGRSATLAVALVAGSFVAAPGANQHPSFSSRVEAVHVDVLVKRHGQFVRGLTAGDFEVFDNGVRQQVSMIEVGGLPLNVVLALDASTSVVGERLTHLRRAGGVLLDHLEDRDRVALLAFRDEPTLEAPLTADRSSVRRALDLLQAGGGTALLDAMYAAIVLGESDVGRSVVVVFTDGADTASFLTSKAVYDVARRTDVVVYAVSSGPRTENLASTVARQTGGRFLELGPRDDLSRAFLELLDEFRQRYLLGYSPMGVQSGGWHEIQVRVRKPSVSVTARSGYLDDR
jgi:VWFA-related protein